MYISCTEEGHKTAAHTHGVLYTVTPLHYALYIAMLPMVVRMYGCNMAGGLLICILYVKPWSYAAPVDSEPSISSPLQLHIGDTAHLDVRRQLLNIWGYADSRNTHCMQWRNNCNDVTVTWNTQHIKMKGLADNTG